LISHSLVGVWRSPFIRFTVWDEWSFFFFFLAYATCRNRCSRLFLAIIWFCFYIVCCCCYVTLYIKGSRPDWKDSFWIILKYFLFFFLSFILDFRSRFLFILDLRWFFLCVFARWQTDVRSGKRNILFLLLFDCNNSVVFLQTIELPL
jgi:hypothetical protein